MKKIIFVSDKLREILGDSATETSTRPPETNSPPLTAAQRFEFYRTHRQRHFSSRAESDAADREEMRLYSAMLREHNGQK
jgi:hypothetical protein